CSPRLWALSRPAAFCRRSRTILAPPFAITSVAHLVSDELLISLTGTPAAVGNFVCADLHLDRACTTHGRIHANGLKTRLSHPLPQKCQFVGLGVEGSHNQNPLGYEVHSVVEVIFGASYHGIVPWVWA